MNRSHWIALIVALAVTAWMGSGIYGVGKATESASADEAPTTKARVRVQTQLSDAADIERSVSVQGYTAPAREITLRAKTRGAVNSIARAEGDAVKKGETLLRIAMRDRKALQVEAEALLKQRELEFKASSRLKKQGMRSDSQQAQAVSQLESARRQLQSIELDIAHTRVRAPFAGVLDQRLVEIGDYLQSGDPVAQVVQLDPFIVVGQVSELEVDRIRPGMAATARLINGVDVEGSIRYVAARAEASTRTFRIEMEVPNPDRLRLFGMTAEIRIPQQMVRAHRVSPAILTLDEAGEVSIKGVDADGRVTRWPVNIVKSDSGGFWLAGLPERAEIIVVGQDYVRAGEPVEAVRVQ